MGARGGRGGVGNSGNMGNSEGSGQAEIQVQANRRRWDMELVGILETVEFQRLSFYKTLQALSPEFRVSGLSEASGDSRSEQHDDAKYRLATSPIYTNAME